jgi:uncharacterized tellurite resistance protein B-like protein
MLGSFFKSLRTPKEGELPDPDAELALGALLVRVAKSDREYQISEITLIDRILARLYQHNAIEAAKIRATCEKLHAAAPDSDTFAKLIRETTGIDERLAALDALWEVVLADGVQNEEEFRVVEEAREAMGLSLIDSRNSRERASHKT